MDKKVSLISRFTSRKFLLTAIGVVITVLNMTNHWNIDPTTIFSLIGLITGYNIVQGTIDYKILSNDVLSVMNDALKLKNDLLSVTDQGPVVSTGATTETITLYPIKPV